MIRSNDWLESRLEYIWNRHFGDIEKDTPVTIAFGRRSYRRLGSIILRPVFINGTRQQQSIVTISALLKKEMVPSFVIDQIIAHEIVHYVHGFGSHRTRVLVHPHQGGVIVREFKSRGLWELYRVYQAWMKIHWVTFVNEEGLK